jgi:hypothetical protein
MSMSILRSIAFLTTALFCAGAYGPVGSDAAGFVFVNITDSAGIEFVHVTGATGQKYLVETYGSGAAFLDYDLDLDPDIYLVNGGALPGFDSEVKVNGALYRNNGDGTFTDVTCEAGLDHKGYGMGAVSGDYDEDGDPDLYLTQFGPDRLFRNNGDGTFTDVTERVGLGNSLWGSGSAWSDLDVDGDLDLYVTNYCDWSFENHPKCWHRGGSQPMLSYCLPDAYRGLPDELYRNRGDGTFEAVGRSAGISQAGGFGLGVMTLDENEDGLPDLFVANDTTPNHLFRNLGQLRFEEVALDIGVAYDADGAACAGMGVDAADYDGDRDLDIIIGHFEGETTTLFRRDSDGFFTDDSFKSGIAMSSLNRLTFGAVFADLDSDSLPELAVANGRLDPDPDGSPQGQTNQLFHNLGEGRFRETLPSGDGFDPAEVSRGLAVADVDWDGDLDLLFSNMGARPDLLRNDTAGGHVLRLLLVGRRSNRDAVGARVDIGDGDGAKVFEVREGSSYLSQSERMIHIGLGARQRVEQLRIRWPGFGEQTLGPLEANQLVVVVQDVGVVASFPLPR